MATKNNNSKQHITILGAGLAGLSASQRLTRSGYQVNVYEKNSHTGGHAASHKVSGFTFDEGIHVSFTKRPDIQQLLAAGVGGKFFEYDALPTNYWYGTWANHPLQSNLYGLPVDVVEKCLIDFVKAREENIYEIRTYADWCYHNLGKTFSEEFIFRYTKKYWTTEAYQMSADWVSLRVFVPTLEEMIHGALMINETNHHYITQFRYPHQEGFSAYVNAVSAGQNVQFNRHLTEIDLKRRELTFATGEKTYYEILVSSLPLPELISLVKDAPSPIKEAASKLSCTSLTLVNVGVKRNYSFPNAHWGYFYDDNIIFPRASFPHRLSPNNVPDGCGSVQVEIYHSKYRPLITKDVLNRAIEDMVSTGLLLKDDQIILTQERYIPYANIVFDAERSANLAAVRQYLNDQGILCCGRFGEWEYFWSDESILSGWRVAEYISHRQ
ncbi:MAG: FAD-dependent oxidoreductase [Chloroflexi bacterium]|nr:FAD-dependent oxidoreductase [Chloroflexota bacterium]